jgi:hypothetical protein
MLVFTARRWKSSQSYNAISREVIGNGQAGYGRVERETIGNLDVFERAKFPIIRYLIF